MATQPMRPRSAAGAAAAPPAASVLGLHHRIELDETLAALQSDGLVTEADVRRVRADVRTARGKLELHPIVLIANLKLADARGGDKPLSVEVLTQWLAWRARLPYLKIDPMKIDVAMSNAFGFGGTNGTLVFKRI